MVDGIKVGESKKRDDFTKVAEEETNRERSK